MDMSLQQRQLKEASTLEGANSASSSARAFASTGLTKEALFWSVLQVLPLKGRNVQGY